MDKSISIIVPAYNEEKNLPQAVADLLAAMKQYRLGFEIVIIDDGSTDATGKVVSLELPVYSEEKVRLIRFGYNLIEVPFVHTRRKHGTSTAFNISSLIDGFRTLMVLVLEVRLRRKNVDR